MARDFGMRAAIGVLGATAVRCVTAESVSGTCSAGGVCAHPVASKENLLLQVHHQGSAHISLASSRSGDEAGARNGCCKAAPGVQDPSVTDEGCAAACAIIPAGTWPCDESGICTCETESPSTAAPTTTRTTTTTTVATTAATTTTAAATTTAPATTTNNGQACAAVWAQCGGKNWGGATCCEAGLECVYGNEWYHQCKPGSSPTPAPATTATTTPAGTTTAPSGQPTDGSWQGENMKMTHYWDCSGQGCDAATLQPWDQEKYVSPPGYGPQNPEDFGGALYGEKMWLTGAASDALSALMGEDDGCCGGDPNDGGAGGCGKCLLVQNPESINPDWTAIVMKKNRCPPWSSGCGANEPHFDVAAPGFDNLQWSTANICGKPGTGFDNQAQSEAVGSWWNECSNTAECAGSCDKLPEEFRAGCKLFASWGWKRGDPKSVKYKAVPCPPAFVDHISKQFGPSGVTA